jgi:hypothetical protein
MPNETPATFPGLDYSKYQWRASMREMPGILKKSRFHSTRNFPMMLLRLSARCFFWAFGLFGVSSFSLHGAPPRCLLKLSHVKNEESCLFQRTQRGVVNCHADWSNTKPGLMHNADTELVLEGLERKYQSKQPSGPIKSSKFLTAHFTLCYQHTLHTSPAAKTFCAPHAHPLLPTAMAFVSYGFVLVRVRNGSANQSQSDSVAVGAILLLPPPPLPPPHLLPPAPLGPSPRPSAPLPAAAAVAAEALAAAASVTAAALPRCRAFTHRWASEGSSARWQC